MNLSEADLERLHAAADEAIATSQPVDVGDIMVVPDVLLIEGAFRGLKVPPPNTWRLRRPDGRSVSLYRIPR